jgi:hypothetical protein
MEQLPYTEYVKDESSKPFPYYPSCPSVDEQKRMMLITELNMWANNDESIARDKAKILVRVLTEQFNLNGRADNISRIMDKLKNNNDEA